MTTKRRQVTIGWAIESTGVQCAVVSVDDFRVVATAEAAFPSAATDRIPGRRQPLEAGSYLRHPREFLPALKLSLAKALKKARTASGEVVAAAMAHDGSWVVPVRKDGSPVAEMAWGKSVPQGWTPPPRHRPPFAQSKRMTALGHRLDEPFLRAAGDGLSSRAYWPRILQIAEENPELLRKTDYFLELGDWLTWTLTREPVCGQQASIARMGGFNGNGSAPSARFLAECDPALGDVAARIQKLHPAILSAWRPAGVLDRAAARKVGLRAGIPIAAPSLSTLSALVGSGVIDQGHILMHWNDPTSHCVATRHAQSVSGMVGTAEGAVLPELWSFEAFQLGLREMREWFLTRLGSGGSSRRRELDPALVKKAQRLRPGETGLVALDWWTGNESLLRDHDLSGALIGLRPDSGPEAIYRALLEAAAFGAYTILRGFDSSGVMIRKVFVGGDTLAECPLLGSILADVLGRELHESPVACPAAVGAALYARAALEPEPTAPEVLLRAVKSLPTAKAPAFRPNPGNHALYERLYDQYLILHEFLGRRSSQLMHDLAKLRALARKA